MSPGPIAERLPRAVRSLLQLGLSLAVILGVVLAVDRFDRLHENVVPRQVDPAWSTATQVPAALGDSWVGDAVSDGTSIYLATRESVVGFWGTIHVRRSLDGGISWLPSVLVSDASPVSARPGLGIAADGTLYVGYAVQGPRPATQSLVVRVSYDHGQSWTTPARVSLPAVGLIGVPVFLMAGALQLVAYTDGQLGVVYTQRIASDGTPIGRPSMLGTTSHELYSDAVFYDGLLALTALGTRGVAVWSGGNGRLRSAISDDAGQSWQPVGTLDQALVDRPRLATDGVTVLLAATDSGIGSRPTRRPFVRIWRSVDGGRTYQRGPDVTDVADVGWLDLGWGNGRWRLLYGACPGFLGCATPARVWYTTSPDGDRWSDATVVSMAGNVRPLGVLSGRFGVTAIWGEVVATHQWRFWAARRDY